MKKVTLTTSFFLILSSFFCCINEYAGTLLNGRVIEGEAIEGYESLGKTIDIAEMRILSDSLLSKFYETNNHEVLSDYGVTLIYLKEYTKAKDIFINLEKEKPGSYVNASNLGTLYELLGQPDSALFWIKKSVEINPDSHHGSEWIHIDILEHKISGKNLSYSSLLNLDFGQEEIPKNIRGIDLDKALHDIKHQLNERMTLVKPKNAIVGNVLFDLAEIRAQQNNTLEYVISTYRLAKNYGNNNPMIDQRIEVFQNKIDTAKSSYENNKRAKEFLNKYSKFILVGGLFFIVFLFFVIRFLIKRLRTK